MIELGHIATGALVGRDCKGPLEALLAGVAMHGLMDVAPHGEIRDRSFEVASTAVALTALASRHGLRSPLVWGAVGSVLPDTEHVLAKGRKPVFPTHRLKWLHSSDTALAVPAWAQVVAGGAIVGALLFSGSARARTTAGQGARRPMPLWRRALGAVL